jgi:heme a synthase
MSEGDWFTEFEKYRASPEFKLLNPHMNLDEFKKIYYMEWTHRLWGRFIGLTFVLPAAYFIARRRVSKMMALNLMGISCLIGFQGFIGWWMVKSGLKDDLFAPGSHPRVSQYRLTAHLATAFVCFAWMTLSLNSIVRASTLQFVSPDAAAKFISVVQNPALNTIRRLMTGLVGLVFLTAMSGALVAGLDAGFIYNEFPYMGNGLTPPASELWDKFYSRKEDGSDLWWRNMLENPSTVQLNHRILATTTFSCIVALFAYSRSKRIASALPRALRLNMGHLLGIAVVQVTLGISTLIYMVPIPLGALHQLFGMLLFGSAVKTAQRFRIPKAVQTMVQKRLKRQ